jgi:hypothetical protein
MWREMARYCGQLEQIDDYEFGRAQLHRFRRNAGAHCAGTVPMGASIQRESRPLFDEFIRGLSDRFATSRVPRFGQALELKIKAG